MKHVLVLSALLLPALVHAQDSYTIKGKVGNLTTPVKAYLSYAANGKRTTDSASVTNGVFTFKGTVDGAAPATVSLNYGPGVDRRSTAKELVSVYLEKGDILITSPDSLKNAVVSGGPNNKANTALNAQLKSATEANGALMARYYASSDEQKKDSVFMSGIIAESEKINAEMKTIQKAFAEKNYTTNVGLEALKQYAGGMPDYAEIKPMFEKFSPAVKNSGSGKQYSELLDKLKAVSIGAIAPEFSQKDTAGNDVSLASFRGKYVLIDFWASWCGPCRAENPNVVRAFNQFKDKNFTILGVSLDRPDAKSKWLQAIADDNLAWTQVSDLAFWDNAAAKLYAVRSIPQNFLLDPQGKIIAKNLRGEALDKKLAEVIK